MRAALSLSLLPLLLLSSVMATASEPTDDPRVAEHRRLSEQMSDLATRNAWSGVDRSFRKMIEQELPVNAEDYKLAAEAARVTGDAQACQDRLLKAMAAMPDIRAARSLAELQGNYGRVILLAKDTSQSLTPVVPPFQPDRAQAIAYASERLAASGRFDGLLPSGEYTFGEKQFVVQPGHEPVQIEIHKLPQ